MQAWGIGLLRVFELNQAIYYYKLPVESTPGTVQ